MSNYSYYNNGKQQHRTACAAMSSQRWLPIGTAAHVHSVGAAHAGRPGRRGDATSTPVPSADATAAPRRAGSEGRAAATTASAALRRALRHRMIRSSPSSRTRQSAAVDTRAAPAARARSSACAWPGELQHSTARICAKIQHQQQRIGKRTEPRPVGRHARRQPVPEHRYPLMQNCLPGAPSRVVFQARACHRGCHRTTAVRDPTTRQRRLFRDARKPAHHRARACSEKLGRCGVSVCPPLLNDPAHMHHHKARCHTELQPARRRSDRVPHQTHSGHHR